MSVMSRDLEEAAPSAAPPFDAVLSELKAVIARDLAPYVRAVDAEGNYPAAFLRAFGARGGFSQTVPTGMGGAGRGMKSTIQAMEEVSKECMSTGFCVWCQTVCAWYIQNGESDTLKTYLLPRIASGQTLAGTGMSNPMKHFAGIEKIRLTAARRPGGYNISGALPWVSNVGPDHWFAIAAQVEGEASHLMAVVPGDPAGLTLGDGGRFIALEGSSTHSAIFKDVFVPDEFLLANPCKEYIARIRAGFILSQTGFGLGLVQGCLDLMRRSNERVGHVNRYLDDGAAEIECDLRETARSVYALADQIGCGERPPGPDATREAIQARIDVSELALRASQAAMLHAGANGYRQGSVAERKLRESYFVAVVTPALKHLKKLQHDMRAVA